MAVNVQRNDFETIQGVETTPQGGRRMSSALTRVGVFKYRDASGRQWSELRPPEEVFAEDSLATLRSAPVVDLHPAGGKVTTENFKALALGHVHDDVRPQGDLVVATTTVNDAEACARIDRGERAETSCGYRCDLDPSPGEWRGERYDQVQRNIRYNHLGIGPKGWARGGGEMALLRCDGAAVQVSAGGPAAEGTTMKKKLKVRGREFTLDADEEVAAAQTAVDQTLAQSDNELAAIKAGLMEALQKIAAYEAKEAAKAAAGEATEAPKVTEEMVPDEVADSIVSKRLSLHEDARKVLGADAKLDGKPEAIKRQVIAKALPTVKLDGLSADTVEGMFRAAVAGAASVRNDALARAAGLAGSGSRHDGQGLAGAQASLNQRLHDAGRKPFGVTTKAGD